MVRQNTVETPPKRARRRPGVGRELILAAAHDVFCEQGYARATTRMIADRAGVAEALLFRQFGTKAALFNEVVFGPIRIFMNRWEELDTRAGEDYDIEKLAKQFAGGLYDLLRKNRGLMVTYFATQVFEPEILADSDDTDPMLDVIQLMDRMADRRVVAKNHPGRRTLPTKARLHERINIGAVIAAALFGDVMFAGLPNDPSRNQIVNELARIAAATLPAKK
ncbi:TetR/AcrR family transcriptional regulator [Mycobacterium arosiense]|nr:TetR/AcrR family transcriptional regulator [Mycobacterium arosiense]